MKKVPPVLRLFKTAKTGRIFKIVQDEVYAYSIEDPDNDHAILQPGEVIIEVGLKNSKYGDHLCLSSTGLVWIEDYELKDCKRLRTPRKTKKEEDGNRRR